MCSFGNYARLVCNYFPVAVSNTNGNGNRDMGKRSGSERVKMTHGRILTYAGTVDHPMQVLASTLVRAIRADCRVDMRHTIIVGDVDLRGMDYSHRVTLTDCTFTGQVNATDAHFAKSVDLSSCTFQENLVLTDARFDGSLVLAQANIHAISGGDATASDDPKIPFERLRVEGLLDASCLTTNAPWQFPNAVLKAGIRMCGAQIGGRVFAEYTEIGGDWDASNNIQEARRTKINGDAYLGGIRTQGQVIFVGAQIEGELILQSAEIGDGLFCRGDKTSKIRTEIKGRVWLAGARVTGRVEFSGAQIGGELNLQSAEIGDGLFCNDYTATNTRTEIGGRVWLAGAKITGNAEFNGMQVLGEFNSGNAEVGGNYLLGFDQQTQEATHISGSAFFHGVNVKGDIVCDALHVKGEFNLECAEIGGNFSCDGRHKNGNLIRPRFHRVNMRGIEVGGAVHFGATNIDEDLILEDAHIAGGISLLDSAIDGDLNMHSADVEGEVFRQSTEVLPNKLANCPNVAGNILLASACLQEVRFYFADVGTHPKAINLEQTEIGKLEIIGKPRPTAGNNSLFQCNGMVFRELTLKGLDDQTTKRKGKPAGNATDKPTTWQDYVTFLALCSFSKGTYLSIEDWLRNRGDDETANKVYLAMRRRDIGVGMPWTRRPLHWFLYHAVGHGVRTWPLVATVILIYLASFVLFLDPGAAEHPLNFSIAQTATQPYPITAEGVARIPERYEAGGPPPQDWHAIDAFWMATRYQFPMISVVADSDWEASSNRVTLHPSWRGRKRDLRLPFRYDSYASTVSMMNWIIVPLLLASFAGLLKKQK